MKAVLYSVMFLLLSQVVLAAPIALEPFTPLEIQLPRGQVFEFSIADAAFSLVINATDNRTTLFIADQEFVTNTADEIFVDVDGNDIADFSVYVVDTSTNPIKLSLSRNIGRVDLAGERPVRNDFEERSVSGSQETSSTNSLDTQTLAVVGTVVVVIVLFLVLQELRKYHHKYAHHPVHNQHNAEVAVIDYIKRHHNKGIAMSEIRKKLESVGWSKELLEEAFAKLK